MPYFITFDIKKLTDNGANNAFPSFSNDGNTVYYQTDVIGNWDIKKLNLETDSSSFVVDSFDYSYYSSSLVVVVDYMTSFVVDDDDYIAYSYYYSP